MTCYVHPTLQVIDASNLAFAVTAGDALNPYLDAQGDFNLRRTMQNLTNKFQLNCQYADRWDLKCLEPPSSARNLEHVDGQKWRQLSAHERNLV